MQTITTVCREWVRKLGAAFALLIALVESTLSRWFSIEPKRELETSVLSPKSVIQLVCVEVDKGALDWGLGEVDYPNHIEVLVGQAAWDRCFGLLTREAQDRIGQALVQHVRDQKGRMGVPEVVLAVDPLLSDEAVRVSVRFSSQQGIAKTMRPAASAVRYEEGEHNKCATPAVPTAGACLSLGERRYDLKDGVTIGRSRYVGREQPCIDLKDEVGFDLVSHLHGRFTCGEKGDWTFVSTGRNGTRVVRESHVSVLKGGKPWELRNGDVLRLGGGSRELVFLAA